MNVHERNERKIPEIEVVIGGSLKMTYVSQFQVTANKEFDLCNSMIKKKNCLNSDSQTELLDLMSEILFLMQDQMNDFSFSLNQLNFSNS